MIAGMINLKFYLIWCLLPIWGIQDTPKYGSYDPALYTDFGN